MNYTSNYDLSHDELIKSQAILRKIHDKTKQGIDNGKGPFYAELYDEHYNFVLGASNSVVETQCALNHAEMNTLKLAFDKYRNYNLSHYKLTLFVNAEPCIMCLGAIMWSGVNKIIFSVPSSEVERITGFDEGFKPNWFEEMKKRNIKACGGIDEEYGKKILQYYVDLGKTIYKPAH
ncbi:nucleoside deaminase [Succinivibrio dextrinosolvens]|uniref:nucleoside deaminase n=1 Tax=Succinivibrio dextrinosolvens TaxID=83771 RepID=UPI00241C30B5|nr:nucleoside deaminase [Succinivibrio dextrinosolvens]MBE6423943.1 nucleoside deaminase [Succinivibrio dextrinosolvens]